MIRLYEQNRMVQRNILFLLFAIFVMCLGNDVPDWEIIRTKHLNIFFKKGSYAERNLAQVTRIYENMFTHAKNFVLPLNNYDKRLNLYLHESLDILGFARREDKSVHYLYSETFQLLSSHEMLHLILYEVNPQAPKRFEEGVCRVNEIRSQYYQGKKYIVHLYQLAQLAPSQEWKAKEIFKDFYNGDIQGNLAAAFVHFCFEKIGKEKFWQLYAKINMNNWENILEEAFALSIAEIDLAFIDFMKKREPLPEVFKNQQ